MDWRREWRPLAVLTAVFLGLYFLPLTGPRAASAWSEALALTQWYAREHVILCLLPAFFIAGAIGVFVRKASVMKYLGAGADQRLAYGVASVSGSVLAVCSCTVLPLFAGIYRMGAGLGPAAAFLYAGPAINVLAVILTARVLGLSLGVARAVGAVLFSIVIGLLMHFFFRREAREREAAAAVLPADEPVRPLGQTALFFGLMIAVLVFATWGRPAQPVGFWSAVYAIKWWLTGAAALALGALLWRRFGLAWWKVAAPAAVTLALAWLFPDRPQLVFAVGVIGLSVVLAASPGEPGEWFAQTWGFAKQILPLLVIGVLAAGALLGRPGEEGLIPQTWVAAAVGGNSLQANLLASVIGAFMYFATLTEIPILQGLIGSGMGPGPALALLLSGPAVSLPSMLVIRSVIGTKKTVVYVLLVVGMATLSGLIYGALL